MIENSIDQIVAVLGVLKAGCAYVPIDVRLPPKRIACMIEDSSARVILSSRKHVKVLNRLLWDCSCIDAFLCLDTDDVRGELEERKNTLMDKNLWEYVGQNANDEISGGGWIDSYTGQSFSREAMDEYGDNVLKKVMPLLSPRKRVLEIGCASGISMFRIAPHVELYYGTDLSEVIIEKNRVRSIEQGITNIRLKAVPAHEIDQIGEHGFDLVILNSVIQCFDGHNYFHVKN